MITVVMPVMNEGIEVYNTLRSIRETSDHRVNIIVVDDGSDDGVNYKGVCKNFYADYIRHDKRGGVAASRNTGIKNADDGPVLVIDSHMRFYEDNWHDKIETACYAAPTTLFQTTGRSFTPQNKNVDHKNSVMGGARVYLDQFSDTRKPLDIKWRTFPGREAPIVKVPAVLGANYFALKEWYMKLKAWEGLQLWGASEQFISLKSHLFGGSCAILTTVDIAHMYRKGYDVPYQGSSWNVCYNKLFINEVLFDKERKEIIESHISKEPIYAKAREKIDKNRYIIDKDREYYGSLVERSYDELVAINNI